MIVAETLELESKVQEKLESTFKKLGYTFEKVDDQSEFFKLIYHVFFGYSIKLEIKWISDHPETIYFTVLETDSLTLQIHHLVTMVDIPDLEKTLKEFEEIEREDGERHPEYFV